MAERLGSLCNWRARNGHGTSSFHGGSHQRNRHGRDRRLLIRREEKCPGRAARRGTINLPRGKFPWPRGVVTPSRFYSRLKANLTRSVVLMILHPGLPVPGRSFVGRRSFTLYERRNRKAGNAGTADWPGGRAR